MATVLCIRRSLRFVLCMLLLAIGSIAQAPALHAQSNAQNIANARRRMVAEEIQPHGIQDARLLDAMREVPREQFLPLNKRSVAYLNIAITFGEGHVMLPPLVTAHMIEQLEPKYSDKVLVVGTGTGYSSALLSRITNKVYTVEIDRATAATAEETFKRVKYDNISLKVGDGFEGWKEHAPFQKIIVECSPENVPQPLLEQLDEGGLLLIPIGVDFDQTMHLYKKVNGELSSISAWPTLLVPMKGRAEELKSSSDQPRVPAINNGGFEELLEGTKDVPVGWSYLRQGRVIEDNLSPEGKRCLQFTNETPGNAAMALQAFPVDGKTTSEITLSFRVMGKEIRPGQTRQQLPRVEVTFFDEKRRPVGGDWVGGWYMNFDWVKKDRRFTVPRLAKFAIVQLTMEGATGEIRFDDIRLTHQ